MTKIVLALEENEKVEQNVLFWEGSGKITERLIRWCNETPLVPT
jgi:hypothetical protein